MSIRASLAAVLLLFMSAPAPALADELKPQGGNTYQWITGDDSEDGRVKWDNLFKTVTYVFGKEPSNFVRETISLYPIGKALDVGMGEGRNAVYLARKGFKVEGVDISEVALRKAKRLAREKRVSITTINADLTHYTIKPESYDVIMDVDYLQRSLIPEIKKGLRHRGVVVFENYTVEQLKNTERQIPRDYLLEKGELRELFKDFQVLVYRETNDGKEAKARIVARKP